MIPAYDQRREEDFVRTVESQKPLTIMVTFSILGVYGSLDYTANQ